MNHLVQAKAECLEQITLPDGYRIEPDCKTDNLMVYGPTLCFCVTAKAIAEGMHKRAFVPAFEGLVRLENTIPEARVNYVARPL